jgi:GT2 family glycosyltransferase
VAGVLVCASLREARQIREEIVDVTVSIVNWNTRDELRECLRTVLAQEGVETEVVVVDNASSDGSAQMVQDEFADRAILIANTSNIGFGAGHNQSMRIARGRYVFLLNPDGRLLEPDVLSRMIDYMDGDEKVGILGPRILNPDGSLQFSARRFPTMLAAAFRHTLWGKLFPNNRFVRRYMMTDWAHDHTTTVDWVSGAAMLLRREMLDRVGLMDEGYFMYCEDVDLCKRAKIAGWKVVYYPEVAVSHRIGAASDQNPIEMIRQHHKSMLRYFLKFNRFSPKLLLLPVVMVGLHMRMRALIRKTQES